MTDCLLITACQSGYACPNGVTYISCTGNKFQNDIGQSTCKPCPQNSTCVADSITQLNTAFACDLGFFVSPDGSSCQEITTTLGLLLMSSFK